MFKIGIILKTTQNGINGLIRHFSLYSKKSPILIPNHIPFKCGVKVVGYNNAEEPCVIKMLDGKLPPHTISVATRDDVKVIRRMLQDTFLIGEPVLASMKLSKDASTYLMNLIVEDVLEGTSLIAKTKECGAVLGFAICSRSCPWHADKLDLDIQQKDPQVIDVITFLNFLTREPDIWRKYNVRVVFGIQIIVTKSCARGSGLGAKLLQRGRELGKDLGYHVLRVDATSNFTSKMCIKQGMKEVYRILYEEYVDKSGKPVFNVQAPHLQAIVYVETPFIPLKK